MKIITLLTDFGTKDSYVAEMKGVMLSLVPGIDIIDISHEVRPQNILEASFILSNSFYYFPEHSVHLAVIDPGVGTDRDIIAVKTEHYTFIAPDNGVLYESVKRDKIIEIKSIDIKRFRARMLELFKENIVAKRIFMGQLSRTFHGRDIFAPLAAYCFLDEDWSGFAIKRDNISKLVEMNPTVRKNKIFGRVVYVDHFGNMITNISADILNKSLKNYRKIEIFIKLKKDLVSIGGLHQTYSEVEEGVPLALVGSRGYIELAVNHGSALNYFNALGNEEVVAVLS